MSERLHPPIDYVLVERARACWDEFPEIASLTDCTEYASPVNPDSVGEDSVAHRLLLDRQPDVTDKMRTVEPNRTTAGLLCIDDVAANDYPTFVFGQEEDKLEGTSFNELFALTNDYAPAGSARHRLRTHVAINDFGKTDTAMATVRVLAGKRITDHDVVLQHVIEQRPDMLPSYGRLEPHDKEVILDVLKAGVNIGQLLLGESSADSLEGLRIFRQRPELFRHAIMEFIYDVAGARGHESQRGSLTYTENLHQNVMGFIRAFEAAPEDASPADIYRDYLRGRAQRFGLEFETPQDVAVTRLCCTLDLKTSAEAVKSAEAAEVADLYREGAIGESSRIILDNALGKLEAGTPVIYYAPKLISNLLRFFRRQDDPDALRNALVLGCSTFAHMLSLHSRRVAEAQFDENPEEQIMAAELARLAGTEPEVLRSGQLQLAGGGEGLAAQLRRENDVSLSGLEQLGSLEELPGNTYITMGMGGGSDVLQASMVGNVLQGQGKRCLGTISVRDAQDSYDDKVRYPKNAQELPGQQGKGVWIINADTTMSSGRYHEDLVARSGPTILILRQPGVSLNEQIQLAVGHLGRADTIVGVDTGGDSFGTVGTRSSSDAPGYSSLDEEVTDALAGLESLADNVYTCVVGMGVDSPPDVAAKLQEAGSQYYVPSPAEVDAIVQYYADLGLPSASPTRFAKTLPALIYALQGGRGLMEAALPRHVLIGAANPWNPFAYVCDASATMIFTKLAEHVRVTRFALAA